MDAIGPPVSDDVAECMDLRTTDKKISDLAERIGYEEKFVRGNLENRLIGLERFVTVLERRLAALEALRQPAIDEYRAAVMTGAVVPEGDE